jgi:hypothetical protein
VAWEYTEALTCRMLRHTKIRVNFMVSRSFFIPDSEGGIRLNRFFFIVLLGLKV